MRREPKLIIFATGGKGPDEGGSGMKKLIEASRDGRLTVPIVGVVSNYAGGGVETKAREFGVPFVHFPKDARTPEGHEELAHRLGGDDYYVALSGCLWLVPMKASPDDAAPGLDPRFVFNIHPALLSQRGPDGHPLYGGPGMYGHFVHEAIMADVRKGKPVRESGVTMHFATAEYDKGPTVFEWPVPILPHDTPETLARAVNHIEHRFQWYITELICTGQIVWDGNDPTSLRVPSGYLFLPVSG